MRNLTRKVHAKFGEASSIRSGGKVGGTKSRNKKKKKKERKKIHFWLENGQFQTVIKSKLFRISTCGKRERINKGIMSSNIRFHEVW